MTAPVRAAAIPQRQARAGAKRAGSGMLVLAVAVGNVPAAAQPGSTEPPTASEPFEIAVTGAEPGATLSGEIRFAPGRARGPLVVVLHSSPGFDGRGAFYAEALNRAGIATVEIDYLRGKGIPRSPRDNLPHVYQTLQQLSRHARIDAQRIGVMGFSWGGILALLTSSQALTQAHAGELRFAAHLGLYPICWQHLAVVQGRSSWFDASTYHQVTGSPVRIVAGGRDAFDDPDSCARFVAALPPAARPSFELTMFPTATFGWDSRFSSASYDANAGQGRGGINRVEADPALAARSRQLVVDFFKRALEVD